MLSRPVIVAFGEMTHQLLNFMRFADLVVMAGGKAPDPIPNSAVKRPSADGTSSQDAGE